MFTLTFSQVNSQDDADAAKKRLQASSAVGEDVTKEERAILMQKELMEQETLLQGYQQVGSYVYQQVGSWEYQQVGYRDKIKWIQ